MSDVQCKTWHPKWRGGADPRYLVLNYEQFQQRNSEADVVAFIEQHVIDFVVIDEIHFTKHREANTPISKRKHLVQALVLEAGKKNHDLCVLGMSGTPVINTLQEGKSLIEMISGRRHDDIETRVDSAELHAALPAARDAAARAGNLTTLRSSSRRKSRSTAGPTSTRSVPPAMYASRSSSRCSRVYASRRSSPTSSPTRRCSSTPSSSTGSRDRSLTRCRDAGLSCRACSQVRRTTRRHHEEFLKPAGKIDVLIASSRIATGVDGLQHVCNKLITNALPWTRAEYDQLVARLWRQGQRSNRVEVIIPVTFAMVRGTRWSYCESKLHRLEYKKTIADAAVDGAVPQGNLRSPAQAQQDIMGWLTRLESGQVHELRGRLL